MVPWKFTLTERAFAGKEVGGVPLSLSVCVIERMDESRLLFIESAQGEQMACMSPSRLTVSGDKA